jgi:uncharacterized lipoprotein YajG
MSYICFITNKMNMKKAFILFAASLIFAACGGSSTETTQDSTAVVDSASAIEVKTSDSTAVSSISAE